MPVGFRIEPITTRDMLERVYAFDEHSYDLATERAGANIPFTLFTEWWTAFPTGFLCALRGGEPHAVVGLFPVSDAWARGFVENRTSERGLRADDIAASDRKNWYFSGLSANARLGRLGPRLPCILGLAILTWARINASVIGASTITLVAEGTTPIGARLLGRLFGDPACESNDGRPRFATRIDLAGVRRMLTGNPFFARCRGLRAEAVETLRRVGHTPPISPISDPSPPARG